MIIEQLLYAALVILMLVTITCGIFAVVLLQRAIKGQSVEKDSKVAPIMATRHQADPVLTPHNSQPVSAFDKLDKGSR